MNTIEINKGSINEKLKDLPLGGILYFPQLSSTNDFALKLEPNKSQDLLLVITNHQTAGRGRNNNLWISPEGSSLTFSLILVPPKDFECNVGLYTALGALAVIYAVKHINESIEPLIKWPNDILIQNKKVCGILVEASWMGDLVEKIVLGIGINVTKESIPNSDRLSNPATCLEDFHGRHVDKLEILHNVIKEIINLRKKIGTDNFLMNWENNLAFRGAHVEVWNDEKQIQEGILIGLARDGALQLMDSNNNEQIIHFGEMHLKSSN